MLFGMSTNDSKTTDVSSVDIDQMKATPTKPRTSKKCVIGAVTAILIVCMTLAAILIGVYFSLEAEKNLVKELVQLRDNTQVERRIDLDSKIVQYYIKVSDYEQWTVDDLNNLVEVARIRTNDGSTFCYVYPLNDTSRADMDQVVNRPLNENSTSTLAKYFHVTKTAIPDTSFLSKTARDLCNGIPMHWVFPVCPGTQEEMMTHRVRRCGFWCWVVVIIIIIASSA